MLAARTAVLLFVRAPALEAKDVGLPHQARVDLFRSMLSHTLGVVRSARVPLDLVIAHDGLESAPSAALSFEQRGSSFGERLLHAVETTRAAGYDRVVMIGADTPELCARDIEQAVSAGEKEAVVGPSADGGFYLLSVPTASATQVIADLPWRDASLTTHLLESLGRSGLRSQLLVARRDVDKAEDVVALKNLLEDLCRSLPECDSLSIAHRGCLILQSRQVSPGCRAFLPRVRRNAVIEWARETAPSR